MNILPKRRLSRRLAALAAAGAASLALAACSSATSPPPPHPPTTAPSAPASSGPARSATCPDGVTATTSMQLAAQHALNADISTGDILRSTETMSELNKLMVKVVCTGAPQVRLDLKWDLVQPNAQSSYNWTLYNHVALVAGHWGVGVQFTLDSDPAWVVSHAPRCQAEPWKCAPRAPPGGQSAAQSPLSKFCAAFAQHFKHTEDVIWAEYQNEPSGMRGYWNNIPRFTADYLTCHRAIKRYAPRIKVEPGGTAAAGSTGAIDKHGDGFTSSTGWYRGMCASGLGSHLNAGAMHTYTFPESPDLVPPGQPDSPWGQIWLVNRILLNDCHANVPINITEMGFPTGGLPLEGGKDPKYIGNMGDRSTTAAFATTATLRIFKVLHEQGIVGLMDWFMLQDNPSADPLAFGLLRADGTPKPAWKVIVAFNRHGRFLPVYSTR